MATLTQQQQLAQLELQLKQLEAQYAALAPKEDKADAAEPAAPDSGPPVMGSSTGFYRPATAGVGAPLSESARGMLADMAMEGGGATAGAMIGAVPALSIPTGGLSIAAGAALGGLLGNLGAQKRRGEDYKVGEGIGAAISSAVMPGAGSVVRSGVKGLAKEAVKQAGANLGAVTASKVIDEGELPDVGEAAIATAAAAAGTGLMGATTTGKKVAKETNAFLRNSGRDWVQQLGSQEGYVFDAVKSNPNALTKLVSKMGAESEIHKQAIATNQEVTNRLIKQELGKPDTWSISELNVKGAIKQANEPYGKLRKLSSAANTLVSELEDTRKLERATWTQWRDKGGAELKEKAVEAGRLAEKIEDKLDTIAQGSGSPGLVDELRAGRVQLGKLYTLHIAGNLPAGNVDARILAAINKEQPDRLTGGFKLASQVAAIQPYMFKPAEKVIPSTTRSGQVAGGLIGLSGGMAAGAGMGQVGMAVGGAMGAGLGMAAAGAAQELLSAPFQKLANSRTYQQALGVPRYQLNAPEAIPTLLLQGSKAAGR